MSGATEHTQRLAHLGDSDPKTWATATKWRIITCISALNLLDTVCSSASATAIPAVLRDFGSGTSNKSTISLVVSIYVLGSAVGPLVVAPLSEQLGRRGLYLSCNLLFIVFNIGCGLSTSIGMLVGFRVLTGSVSAAPATIGGGTIADLMEVKERTLATGVWMGCSIVGPILGPIVGGLIAEAGGWRWIYYAMAIGGGATGLPCLIFVRETHRPTLLRRKQSLSQGETATGRGMNHFWPTHNVNWTLVILRPLRLLFTNWTVFLSSLYSAVADGYMFIILATFAEVFVGSYSFSIIASGFACLGLGFGAVVGHVLYVTLTDRTVRVHQGRGDFRPEHRIMWMPIGALAIPVGLFSYGWMIQTHVHWIVPVLALLPCGVGFTIMMVPPVAYLIDVFSETAASAIAAMVVLRAVAGAFLPLLAFPLYHRLGQGWGNTLLAGVALLLSPLPWLMFLHGGKLRSPETM